MNDFGEKTSQDVKIHCVYVNNESVSEKLRNICQNNNKWHLRKIV